MLLVILMGPLKAVVELTVSKLPLCRSSIGGRNRSARVLSFLSIAFPFLNSCSCRTKHSHHNSRDLDEALDHVCHQNASHVLTGFCLKIPKSIKDWSCWSTPLWYCEREILFVYVNKTRVSQIGGCELIKS